MTKSEMRREAEALTAEFLARGGRVVVCPAERRAWRSKDFRPMTVADLRREW